MNNDNNLRKGWKEGSMVEIYSNSKQKWFKGEIIKIVVDVSNIEWLIVKYNETVLKEIQRENDLIRPYHKILNETKSKSSTLIERVNNTTNSIKSQCKDFKIKLESVTNDDIDNLQQQISNQQNDLITFITSNINDIDNAHYQITQNNQNKNDQIQDIYDIDKETENIISSFSNDEIQQYKELMSIPNDNDDKKIKRLKM